MELRYNLRKRKFINQKENIAVSEAFIEIKKEVKYEVKTEKLYEEMKLKANYQLNKTFCSICSMYFSNSYIRRHQNRHNLTSRCDNCNLLFSESGLKSHRCISKYPCDICSEKFPCRSKLDAHFRMHSNIENRKSLILDKSSLQTKCNTCSSLIDCDKIKEHELTHSKYVCRFCGIISRNRPRYLVHHRMHLKKLKNPCKECNESFEHLVNLARHISVVHRKYCPSKTECPLCFKMVSGISAHLRTHESNPTECEICHAILKNYSAYKAHVRFHNILFGRGYNRAIVPMDPKSKQYKHKCQTCDKSFCDSAQLSTHLKSHIQVAHFSCPYCDDYTCSRQEDIIDHVSHTHRSIPGVLSQCPHCAAMVPDLENHLDTHTIAMIDCELCKNVSFFTESSFRKHWNKKHRRKSKHMHYLDVYREKYTLITNTKKVPCLLCGCSVRVSHMRWHLREQHSPLRCRECRKTMRTVTNLRHHREGHDDVGKSYRCAVCTHSYLSHVRLVAHMLVAHKMPTSTARTCAMCCRCV